MSNSRQPRNRTATGADPERTVMVRSYAVTHPHNLSLVERSFDRWNQLAYAARGVMDVHTADGSWIVPPHRAVWIPAGIEHSVHMAGTVAVRTLFFKRGLGRGRVPLRCQAVNVSPLLRELVLRVTRLGLLHSDDTREARLARVVLDQLEALPIVPLQLPWPRDPRARAAAEHLIRDPAVPNALMRAAKRAGASRRTLERCFNAETSMTLGRWLQRARLIEGVRRLACGIDVTSVALDVGYSGPSAFIAAFRAQLGTTPARYFSAPRPN